MIGEKRKKEICVISSWFSGFAPPTHWFLLVFHISLQLMKLNLIKIVFVCCLVLIRFNCLSPNEVVFPIKIRWNIKYEFVHHLSNRLCSSLWCSNCLSLKSVQCIFNVCLRSAPSAASSLCRNRKFSSRYLGRCRNRSNNLSFAGAYLSLMMSLFPLWLCPKRDCQMYGFGVQIVLRRYPAVRWETVTWACSSHWDAEKWKYSS